MVNKIFIAWNGMASHQVSGGDMYIKKFIEGIDLSEVECDLMSAGTASALLDKNHSRAISSNYNLDDHFASGLAMLILTYLTRTLKSFFFGITLRRKRYSLSLASSPFIYDILPVVLLRSQRKAVVLFHLIPERKAHSLVASIRFRLARIEQQISLAIIGKCFDVILVGNDDLKHIIQNKFPSKLVIVAHAGIDTEKIDRYDNHPEKDKNVGVFVGRLTQQKGVIDLVHIAEALSLTRPDFRLVVIGDGPDRRKIESMVKQKGLKNIDLRGFVPEQEKYDILGNAKFFIFPSYEEGWGIALAEALYLRCLVVCYELSHYRSLFEDYPVYAPLGNYDALINAVDQSYTKIPRKDQQEFIRKYDDVTVVRSVLNEIGL